MMLLAQSRLKVVPSVLVGALLSTSDHTAYWISPTVYGRFAAVHVWLRKSWLKTQLTAGRFSGFSRMVDSAVDDDGAYVLYTAAR
jgi:hypothetical protein